MNKKRKLSVRGYAAWNYDKEEKDLDKYSKEGWQIIKGGCFHSVFEKDNSVCYRNRIDFNPKILSDIDERERYISSFEEMGWEFINVTFNGWCYFKKLYNESSTESDYEIYSDKASYVEMLKRWMKLGTIAITIEIILCAIYLIQFFIHKSPVFLFGIIIFATIIFWIKSGMNTMNEKMNEKSELL